MNATPTPQRWLGRFAVRLMQLRQDLPLAKAVSRAVSAHAYASDLAPEHAAELDVTQPAWHLPVHSPERG